MMLPLNEVDSIQLEFFAGYPFGYYKILYQPDGTVVYTCDGEDLPFHFPNGHHWTVSKRIYQNLVKVLLARPWEQEVDPRVEPNTVCDGWTDVLSWYINGELKTHSLVIGLGPASLIKVMGRIKQLAKNEDRMYHKMKITE